jgi:hypothetical protein
MLPVEHSEPKYTDYVKVIVSLIGSLLLANALIKALKYIHVNDVMVLLLKSSVRKEN